MTDVWVSVRNYNYGRNKYHTDPECQYVTDDDHMKRSLEWAERRDLDECKRCSGEYERHRNSGIPLPAQLRGDDGAE